MTTESTGPTGPTAPTAPTAPTRPGSIAVDRTGADAPQIPPERVPRKPGGWRALAVFTVGMLTFWVVGYLPWIVGGMRLPISSAWPTVGPDSTPLVALPWGEYELWSLLTGGVIGGIAAILTSRLWRPAADIRRGTVFLASLGATIGACAALGWNAVTLAQRISQTTEAGVLVIALFAVFALGVIVGQLCGVALLGRPWGRLMAVAIAAGFLVSWLGWLANRIAPGSPNNLHTVTQWAGAVVLGLGLAHFGFRPGVRVIGWALAAAIYWVVPAIAAAVGSLAPYARSGSVSSLSGLADLADMAWDVFTSALSPGVRDWMPLAGAIVIGIVGAVMLSNRADEPDPTRDRATR